MLPKIRIALNSERGHVGPTTMSLVAIAATIVTAVGLSSESHVVEIIGVAMFGACLVAAFQIPHWWLRKIYRRIDRITDDSDPDRHEEFRFEL
jgi:hypothetical protein